MLICQPVHTTIYTTDFRNKQYSFSIESVLNPEAASGVLVVTASEGYLLTTSETAQPEREQIIEPSRQADGSWVASGTVTLLLDKGSPIDGTVVIRNALAESIVLTIDSASTSRELSQMPTLTVSEPVLTFATTSSGKPSFLVMTVKQQHSDSPVTLSTDAPDYFQLASDSRPYFASTLTLTPSPTGSYVHVRYVSDKSGLHKGQLLIHSAYEDSTIALTGRSAGLLPMVLHAPSQPGLTKWILWAFAIVVVSGLAYTGYTNRCQLFPALCQGTITSQPTKKITVPEIIRINDDPSEKKVVKSEIPQKMVTKTVESPIPQTPVSSNKPDDRSTEPPVLNAGNEQRNVAESRNAIRPASSRKPSIDQTINNVVDKRSRRRATATPKIEESELERELNQHPKK
ncbi:hypothetical protein [Spirosoma flavum]|uniref:Uncharacterized protein n=1 Tax=Spirosoma flavum TaxID=2048557 RepID=A0ABW6AT02_9BACT